MSLDCFSLVMESKGMALKGKPAEPKSRLSLGLPLLEQGDGVFISASGPGHGMTQRSVPYIVRPLKASPKINYSPKPGNSDDMDHL